MIALMLTVELLTFTPQSPRVSAWWASLAHDAPRADVSLKRTSDYEGASDVLLIWGPGAPNRFEPMRAQLAQGKHVIACDLPYWQRDRKMRISIDAAHPQAWVMRRDWPATRLQQDGIRTENRWNPTGPVIVAGIGRKARVQYGAAVGEWETRMIQQAEARWHRPVRYRRKQLDAPVPAGVALTSDRPIDDVLDGASLLITWHSNVAVDAIRLGIPVICKDGAAAAVCPSTFTVSDPLPLEPSIRDRFLANLAWFQWTPEEAKPMWRWVRQVLA